MSAADLASTPSSIAKTLAVVPQPFETSVFGAPVWRLEIDGQAGLDRTALDGLTNDARRQKVALIVARIPSGSTAGRPLAEAGFRQIERLITFRRDIPAALAPVPGVSLAEAGDAEACAAIGRTAFFCDRFHADSRIADAMADEIKARWARNGIDGRADAPLVVREAGAIAGFDLCMRKGEDAVIDLIAVDRRWQGRGLGRKLVEGALAHYAGAARTLWVSTQEANAASVALYRSAGFALDGVAETWHWTL